MAEKSAEASPSMSCSSPQDEQPANNWWDSWLSSAKTKSAEVYTMVKKDLDEIGSAVKSEASHVFSSTSNVVSKTFKLDVPESPANVMKKSFSTFIGQVSTVLNPEPDDEDDTEVILSSGDTTMLSTYKKELEKIQRLDATFIVPPLEAEFGAWYASLEAAEGGVISLSAAQRRLESSPLLAAQYKKLVPDAVTREQFWERYLFRVALLQDRLAAAARRQSAPAPQTDPVMQHLPLDSETGDDPIQQSPKKVLSGVESDKYEVEDTTPADTAVTWEDEDFAADVELTEEQQILLLEEYEKEIASKKQQQPKPRDITNNNTKTTTTNTANTKSKTKAAQTRDKMNNKTEKKIINRSPKKSQKDSTDNKNRSPKKSPKTDVCGNDLVEDYFGEKEVKDDASANSDESWEKEFEIDDVEQKV